MKIVSGVLLLLSLYFGISHGSRVFTKPSADYVAMMSSLGITNTIRIVIGVWAIVAALLILFPTTFFWGNTLRAVQIVFMMALALQAGRYTFALVEIPFLLMPLLLIYWGHPLTNR